MNLEIFITKRKHYLKEKENEEKIKDIKSKQEEKVKSSKPQEEKPKSTNPSNNPLVGSKLGEIYSKEQLKNLPELK